LRKRLAVQGPNLTNTEMVVASMVRRVLSFKAIAGALNVWDKTVACHRQHIRKTRN
jgi:DNA-binding NarL/FixJ family response regulator